jgi:hypothetical protein
VSQLEMALSVPAISGVHRSRVQARLDEVREALFAGKKQRRDTEKDRPQQPGHGGDTRSTRRF